MFKIFSTSVAVSLAFLSTPVSAAEIKGADLVAALNGNTFDCKFSSGSMVWSFAKSDPAGNNFPYTVTMDGKTTQAGYKLHKNGKMRHASTNASRKIVQNKNGSLTVSASGIQKTTCVKR